MKSSGDEKFSESGQVSEPDCEVEGLRLALSVARETNSELRNAATLARAQAAALRIDISLREDELASLRSDHRAALAGSNRVEAELGEASASIEALRTTLAGRDQDLASRDAQIGVVERGIQNREQQLAASHKELDRVGEQLTLFDGEIQSQRALIESARQAIGLRDDRIAYLQHALHGVEQLAGGAANADALPRPSSAFNPAVGPAPVQVIPQVVQVVSEPLAPAAPVQHAVVPEAVAPPVEATRPPPAEQALPVAPEPVAEPAVEAEAAVAVVEPTVEPDPVQEPIAAKEDATEESSLPDSEPAVCEAAADTPTDTPNFFRDPPRISTPIFRHWRDSRLEKEHPDEQVISVDMLFALPIAEACKADADKTIHIWSLSGGDTQSEVRIAAVLRDFQIENYVFHVLDSQAKKLKKQRTMVVSGLELKEKFDIHEGELTNWPEDAPCDFVLADGSISSANHPEALLDRVASACQAGAKLLITDWIGSSAPLPEAAVAGINEIFTSLDEKKRKNKVEGVVEEEFVDRRASERDSVSSELIAMLEARFTFALKYTFGSLVDSIAGPEFGPNFKVKEADDVAIVEKLALLDQTIMNTEELPPRFLVGILQAGDVEAPVLLGTAAAS